MERKFMNRFRSFENSLDALFEARDRDSGDSFVLSGTSAKFSITFELAWKTMKDILIEYYAITDFVAGSPRETLKKAFQTGIITGDEWLQMLELRNRLSHDYDGEIIKSHWLNIVRTYTDKFSEFRLWVNSLNG